MFIILNIIAFILVFIGSLNWGLVGIFNWNLVDAIFGIGPNVGTIIVYVLVLVSALWLLFSIIYNKGVLYCCNKQLDRVRNTNTNTNTNKKEK